MCSLYGGYEKHTQNFVGEPEMNAKLRIASRTGMGIWEVLQVITIFFIQPLKIDLTEGSETSVKLNLTLGNT
jgi:hypothetical protein